MAADDYHVIVFEILSYLYDCLKKGVTPDMEAVEGYRTATGINMRYWSYVLKRLQEEGLVENMIIAPVINAEWKTARFSEGTAITSKGIAYLAENSMMEKVKKFGADSVKSITSGIAARILGGM